MTISQRRLFGSMSGRQRGTIREANGSVASSDSDSDLLMIDDEDEEDLLNMEGPDIDEFNSKLSEEKRAMSKADNTDDF